MTKAKSKIGVVGATGLVGQEILKVLEEREFPVESLRLWASQKSAGQEIEFAGSTYAIEELTEKSISESQLDFVLFAAGGSTSEKYAPLAAATGAIVIDNSSHFRLHPEVPLVVPEVNPEAIKLSQSHGIIANPNCSTIQMVAALKPLHDQVPIKRVVVSTYQAVSGAGAQAMEELETQVGALFSQSETKAEVFPHQIAFNCLPHIDVFQDDGYTKEEQKMMKETPKILGVPDLKVTATCVRVPVFMCHSESINIEFEDDLSAEDAVEILENAPGIVVMDHPKTNLYPLNFSLAGRDEVFVGRIREDASVPHGLHLWVVADNLRKGAATNAVQIAETCLSQGFSRRSSSH